MLSVSDVNGGGYIVNRYSRLAARAGPGLRRAATDKWNIFRGLNQRKMGFGARRAGGQRLPLLSQSASAPAEACRVTKEESVSRLSRSKDTRKSGGGCRRLPALPRRRYQSQHRHSLTNLQTFQQVNTITLPGHVSHHSRISTGALPRLIASP